MVRARILWPALGFPAVISPRNNPPAGALAADGDATRCICVLLLSDRRILSKADAAQYLRYVSWDERGRRHIRAREAGSFREEELSVRNSEITPLSMPHPKDRLGDVVVFGADRDGKNGIVASLSLRVREFYRQQGLLYLHEIRVYERALSRLTEPLYHLFWNNESPATDVPSDEMALLLSKFAPSRRADVGPSLPQQRPHLTGEYEFEYGSQPGPGRVRSEILHPVFVQGQLGSVLRVGHVTDTHVDVRHDVYEENLKHSTFRNLTFNNWNKSFVAVYERAKTDADVILLTGDLIDYGRGHLGLAARGQLGQDAYYHVDRNWFLFSRLLASGKSYTRPVYTILGNHDWRLNPYTPLAIAGAPGPTELFHHMPEPRNGAEKERQRDALRAAHGPGHSRIISYVSDIEKKWQTLVRSSTLGKLLQTVFLGSQTADIKKYPTETTVESVEWYLQTINPFLDYWFTRPHGQQVLMLDWAEDETVMFPEITHGRRHGLNLAWLVAGKPGSEGPKARNCLTDLQWWLVKRFVEEPGRAKIIGIHAPPIGPWADWSDDEMLRGVKTYLPDAKPRGATGYMTRLKSGGTRPWNGHPLFAIRPAQEKSSDQVFGMDASYNSFERKRPEFIRAVAAARAGVRLVLSGHIHRNGLFAVYQADKARGSLLKGQWLLQYLVRQAAEGVTPPAVSKSPLIGEKGNRFASGPLYVNTTSAGPRGNDFSTAELYRRTDPGFAHVDLAADGTIQRVEFRRIEAPAAATTTSVPPPARPVTAPTGAPLAVAGARGR